MTKTPAFEVNIGLEVHVQLLTNAKLFCSDANLSLQAQNTNISPISLGHPGTLPHLNEKALELAVQFGLATHSTISDKVEFARKHYCYPDLPKGYQITQHDNTICQGGFITISTTDTKEKRINLHHTHLEEDAGKSIHDIQPDTSCLDYNRAGTPLIEIVTMPEMTSAEEACAFVEKIQKIVRYNNISNADMEKGNLRCDANISLRPKEQKELGTKIEIKNINSFRFLNMAIQLEIERMTKKLRNNETIIQETRGLDTDKHITYSLRNKEDAHDYRYMPDPDLPTYYLSKPFVEKQQQSMAEPLEDISQRLLQSHQLSEKNIKQLLNDLEALEYYQFMSDRYPSYTDVFNWIFGPIKTYLNKNNLTFKDYPIDIETSISILKKIQEGSVSHSIAVNKMLPYLLKNPLHRNMEEIIKDLDLNHSISQDSLNIVIEKILDNNSDKVRQYEKKRGLLSFFVGQAMRELKGNINPKLVNEHIIKALEKRLDKK